MTQESSQKSYDLSKLYNFVGTDPAIVKEMVVLFITTIPPQVQLIITGLNEKNYGQVSKAAHAIKPSLDVFGIAEMHDPIRTIESNAKSGENIEELTVFADQLDKVIVQVISELNRDFI
ncbi:MAG: Hpt domain-containing protein [Ignavibacteria bacterium]|nr:Hpt domain-containing protein [Ignavibacteria bacterium]